MQGTLTQTPWGRTLGSSGASASAYQFGATSGYRSDGDRPAGEDQVAYVKVGCRYYDPLFGRFLSRDTDLDQKPYAYCNGDPVNLVDEDGHAPKKPPTKPQPKPVAPPYPWQWPPEVDVDVKFSVGVGIKDITTGGDLTDHIKMPGPPYWQHMPPADRSKTHTFIQFQEYIIEHLHTAAF